jgi:hypothetical protein
MSIEIRDIYIQWSRFNQKWLPGQILSCLDLNCVKIGPKMTVFVRFGLNLGLNNLKFNQEAIFNQIVSVVNSEFNKYLTVVFVNSHFSEF